LHHKKRCHAVYSAPLSYGGSSRLGAQYGKSGPVTLALDPKTKKPLYEEAYTSTNAMVRIFKVRGSRRLEDASLGFPLGIRRLLPHYGNSCALAAAAAERSQERAVNPLLRRESPLQVSRPSLKSKRWCVENPGKYPPALDGVIAKRQAFEQIHGLSVDDAKDLFGLTIEVAGGGGHTSAP
jgi:hypothetical protein